MKIYFVFEMPFKVPNVRELIKQRYDLIKDV